MSFNRATYSVPALMVSSLILSIAAPAAAQERVDPNPGKVAVTETLARAISAKPSDVRRTPKVNSTGAGENISSAACKPTVGSAVPSPTRMRRGCVDEIKGSAAAIRDQAGRKATVDSDTLLPRTDFEIWFQL